MLCRSAHGGLGTEVSSGCRPCSGVAGPYGSFIPSFQRNLHTVFHSGCISLQSHQLCKGGSLFSIPSPAFIFIDIFFFLDDDGHPDRCEVLPAVLISIPLIMSDVEHFFCTCTAAFDVENKLVVTSEGGGGGEIGVGRGKYKLLDIREAQG